MSHLDNSGSEDGQLRSPGDDNYLSEGEQCDTADSLDIKPPQATKRESGRKKSSKKDKHSREHKHKDRERDRDRDRIPRERDKDGSRGEERRHRHSGFRRDRDRHNHRREYYEQQHQRDYEYHNRQKQQREREKRVEQGPRDRDRRKYNMDQQYESNVDAEKALEDLRSRLLSKRNKYQKEIARYEDQGHYESISPKRRSSGQEYRKEHKERKENIIEVIDSPEHYSDYGSGRRKDKRAPVPEDPEQACRRAKLLEAEREMARRKEVAREELEARRSRRERDDPVSPPEQVKPKLVKKRYLEEQGHVTSRKRSKNSSPPKDNEYGDKIVQNISDDSEMSSEDEKEEGGTGSESESSTGSEISKNEKSGEEDDALPGSPLSVGDLSKSDHRHNESKSRSTSVSLEIQSQSNSERSKRSKSFSKSKSPHFASRSGSEVNFESKSLSPHSRSRSASRDSGSRSHSHSGSDSEKDEISKAEPPEEGKNDVEMKSSDEINKEAEEEAQKSPKMDESPRDENGEKLPNYFPGIQGCRSVEEFQCLNRIEEGTYGVVYRAKDKRTNEIVALKRLKMEKEKEGFPITSLREINTLLKGQHPNIVTVREIVVGSNMDKIFIVMDYVEHDLKSLMETMKHKDQIFFPGEVKCLLQQLLRAVAHLHDNWILHRDLKTSNLLLSHKGILKVGDFGLAREYGSPLKAYTSLVVTLWYRAPELLLCAKEYSTAIDMWSVGCIFGEFLQMGPLFPEKSEIDQLNRIFKELGTPNEKIWPGYKDLPAVQNLLSQNSHFTEYPVSNLRRRFFNKTTEMGISLLQGLLTYDPKQRLTAELALRNPYFKELPLPIDPSMFPTWPAKSELGARKALASSPKAPSGGSQFKQLGREDMAAANNSNAANKTGFVLNAGIDQRQLAMGPGFNLKF